MKNMSSCACGNSATAKSSMLACASILKVSELKLKEDRKAERGARAVSGPCTDDRKTMIAHQSESPIDTIPWDSDVCGYDLTCSITVMEGERAHSADPTVLMDPERKVDISCELCCGSNEATLGRLVSK